MGDSNATEFKISFLQHEYRRYALLLHNQIQHIERLYKENFININVRNTCIKSLNDLIRYMNNDVYNVKLKELKESKEFKSLDEEPSDQDDETTPDNNNINISESNKSYSEVSILDKNICEIIGYPIHFSNGIGALLDLCKSSKISNIKNLMFDDFNKVGERLLKICSDVGFYSIDDALNLLIGSSHREFIKENNSIKATEKEKEAQEKINEFREILELYNLVFIPVNYKCKNDYKESQFFVKSSMDSSIHPPSEIYIDSYAELSLCFPHTEQLFIFGGYFINDPIQCIIRTSQISRHFLYKKKRLFLASAEKCKSINPKFASLYIKNISIGELLSYDEKEFISKLDSDFTKYSRLSKMTFKNLMDEFTRDIQNNLKNMYTIIRLLLLGPDDSINIAGLLFGLTKDKKYGAEIIAELIYRRLTYVSQTKLKKSSINIKNELEKLKNMSESDVDIKKQLASNSNIPAKIKKIIFDKLEELKFGSTETSKHKTYIDILCNYPWQDTDYVFNNIGKDNVKCREFMNRVKQTLNEKVYGHAECKQVIQELICKWIMNPKSIGKALGLVGPPGVGKTLIAKGLGDALGIPYCSISLCGVEDPAVLNGHSFTYSAAQPGIIVRKMVEAGKARCILFFDELDKSSQKHGANEVQNVFINLTDQNMNANFSDKFFQEVTFPLDKVLFVFSYNDRSKIDKILLNRIHEIEVRAYTAKDKLRICQDFLLKEIIEGIGMEVGSIQISDENIYYLIENYTYEPGVRELKRKVETIFLKLNLDRIYQKGLFACECKKVKNELPCSCDNCGKCEKCNTCAHCNPECTKECSLDISPTKPVIVTKEIIVEYLNKPKIDIERIHNISEVGIVNGLYATELGYGGIIKILIYKNFLGGKGKFTFKLTGSQGTVMKESATFAFTTAVNLVKEEFVVSFIKKYSSGLHIHTPDGATPKDGPSAGSAFTTALISRILEKKVRNDIAMTGEIGEFGEIKIIGGLLYKLRGAKTAGVKTVFVPASNQKDIDDIKVNDKNLIEPGTFDVIPVTHIRDILKVALIDDDAPDKVFDPAKYLNEKYLK